MCAVITGRQTCGSAGVRVFSSFHGRVLPGTGGDSWASDVSAWDSRRIISVWASVVRDIQAQDK
jgi:hypothetical protein